ncbi:MAG: hypothetical protein RSE41_01160 [Clostridia bacterium]
MENNRKLTTEYQEITDEKLKNNFNYAIPVTVFPNQMGINLSSVKGMEVVRQEDGQLVSVRVDFIPAK